MNAQVLSLSLDNPLGVFRAKATRDALAQEYDGEKYFARRDLASQGSEPIAEIQFADGIWMLVNPVMDLTAA